MKIMLEEIARKKAEAEQMRAEEQMRAASDGRKRAARARKRSVVLQFAQCTDD